jgi:hypothetical protein
MGAEPPEPYGPTVAQIRKARIDSIKIAATEEIWALRTASDKAAQRIGALLLVDAKPGSTADLSGRGPGPKYSVESAVVKGVEYRVLLRERIVMATLPETPDPATRLYVAVAVRGEPSPLPGTANMLLHEIGEVSRQMIVPREVAPGGISDLS